MKSMTPSSGTDRNANPVSDTASAIMVSSPPPVRGALAVAAAATATAAAATAAAVASTSSSSTATEVRQSSKENGSFNGCSPTTKSSATITGTLAVTTSSTPISAQKAAQDYTPALDHKATRNKPLSQDCNPVRLMVHDGTLSPSHGAKQDEASSPDQTTSRDVSPPNSSDSDPNLTSTPVSAPSNPQTSSNDGDDSNPTIGAETDGGINLSTDHEAESEHSPDPGPPTNPMGEDAPQATRHEKESSNMSKSNISTSHVATTNGSTEHKARGAEQNPKQQINSSTDPNLEAARQELREEIPVPPRTLHLLRAISHSVRAGDTFPSRGHAIMAICEMHELHRRRHSFAPLARDTSRGISTAFWPRFTPMQIHARCAKDECTFRVRVHRRPDTTWVVTLFTSHSCLPLQNPSPPVYQPKMLADVVVPLVMVSPDGASLRALRESIAPYVAAPPPKQFCYRAKHAALRSWEAKLKTSMAHLPRLVTQLTEHGHSAQLVSKPSEEAVSFAVAAARAEYDRDHDNTFQQQQHHHGNNSNNDGGRRPSLDESALRNKLLERTKPGATHLYALLFAPSVAKQLFPRLVPVIHMGSASCHSDMRGTVFVALGSDADRRPVLLSFMLAADAARDEPWRRFLRFTQKAVGAGMEATHTVLTDGSAAMATALQAEWPKAQHFVCVNSRRDALLRRTTALVASIFGRCAAAGTTSDVERLAERVPERFRAAFNEFPPSQQFPAAHGALFGRGASTAPAFLNGDLKAVRALAFPAAFVQAVLRDAQRHVAAARAAADAHTKAVRVPPRVVAALKDVRAEAQRAGSTAAQRVVSQATKENGTYYGHRNGYANKDGVMGTSANQNASAGGQVLVTCTASPALTVLVDVTARTCQCGLWSVHAFPCVHAARAAIELGLDLETLLEPSDKVYNWKQQYADAGEYFVPSVSTMQPAESRLLPPIVQPVARGRPKKRLLSSMAIAPTMPSTTPTEEPVRRRKCRNCRQTGHNKASCTSPPV